MNGTEPDLVIRNSRVLTMDSQCPTAQSVAVKGDRITWVGSDHDSEGLISNNTQVINGYGRTLLPGFHDAHIHFLAYAASLHAVDCSPTAVSSIQDIKQTIARRVGVTEADQWIRAVGYSDFDLRENRHPTRWDLDEAAPNNPVRLNHRSGHACVLNSRALELVGISGSTTEPQGSTILRDLTSGVPNGVLLEMDEFLDGKIPPLTKTVLESNAEEASNRLAAVGITSIQDATASNSVARWEMFRTLKSDRRLTQRTSFMIGVSHIFEFSKLGLNFGAGNRELKIGATKIMLTEPGGQLHPGVTEIREIVADLHQRGFQVAIHAVNSDAVSAAAGAIKLATSQSASRPANEVRHRIEHCSELPPDVLRRVIASGAVVVTQPGFIFSSGQRYAADISIRNQQWLYRIGALQNARVGLGFGSDAPVIDPNPMFGIYSAVSRKSANGNHIAANEAVSLADAIEAYTLGSAYAGHSESHLGMTKPGFLADLVLLDRDITAIEPSELSEVKASRTIIGGSEVWNIEDS